MIGRRDPHASHVHKLSRLLLATVDTSDTCSHRFDLADYEAVGRGIEAWPTVSSQSCRVFSQERLRNLEVGFGIARSRECDCPGICQRQPQSGAYERLGEHFEDLLEDKE